MMGRIKLSLLIIIWICIAPAFVWSEAENNNTYESVDTVKKSDNMLAGLNGPFESSDVTLTDWMIVDQGTKQGPSSWIVSGGKLIQSSNIYGGDGLDNDADRPGTYAVIGNDNWTDLILNVDLYSRNDGLIGVMFRYKDGDNYYRFAMDKKRRCRRLVKKVKGVVTVLAQDRVSYSRNRWYTITIKTIKDNIIVAVDGKYLFEVKDKALSSGKIGLYCCENAGSEFRNISVTSGTAGDYPIPDDKPETMADITSPTIPIVSTTGKTDCEPSKHTTNPEQSGYIIGSGDVLFISVWKDEALTNQVIVLPDGTIAFPLVGGIQAAGKTVAALKTELEEKIKHYLPDPTLTVMVQQVNSMQIYIIGRVNRPGSYPLNTNLNVLQALSMAGGLNPFADGKKIKILREGRDEKKIYPFNYKEVTQEEKLDQNITLERGDVIVVP